MNMQEHNHPRITMKLNRYLHLSEVEMQKIISDLFYTVSSKGSRDEISFDHLFENGEIPSATIGYILTEVTSENVMETKHFSFPVILRFVGDIQEGPLRPQYLIKAVTEEEGNKNPASQFCESDSFFEEDGKTSPEITASVCTVKEDDQKRLFLDYEYGYETAENHDPEKVNWYYLDYEYGYTAGDLDGEVTMISYLRLLNRNTHRIYQVI